MHKDVVILEPGDEILNPFCGVGGSTRGLQLAGYKVVGVDNRFQPDYIGDKFYQADAIDFIYKHGCEFKAIFAEPPCQDHIAITAGNRSRPGWKDDHENLIIPTRIALQRIRNITNIPTVIECGVGKHIRPDVILCMDMFYNPKHFAPRVQMHRYFECDNIKVPQPKHIPHIGLVRGWRHGVYQDGPYVAVYGEGGGKATIKEAQRALGINWTENRESLNEAIPPAYTRYIARFLSRQEN